MRKTKYELIRIFAATFIILNHVPCSENALTVNVMIKKLFFLGGQFGVNLFVILGAWFLVDCSEFKFVRVYRIVEKTVFYSIILDAVTLVVGFRFDCGTFARSFSYWYSFAYVTVLFVTPYLQKLRATTEIKLIGMGGGYCMFGNGPGICHTGVFFGEPFQQRFVYWASMV